MRYLSLIFRAWKPSTFPDPGSLWLTSVVPTLASKLAERACLPRPEHSAEEYRNHRETATALKQSTLKGGLNDRGSPEIRVDQIPLEPSVQPCCKRLLGGLLLGTATFTWNATTSDSVTRSCPL